MAVEIPRSFSIPEQLREAVQQLAERRAQTADELLRLALEEFLERQQLRDQFNQDTVQAWEDFGRTGLHATHDQVDALLRKRAAGEQADPPHAISDLVETRGQRPAPSRCISCG